MENKTKWQRTAGEELSELIFPDRDETVKRIPMSEGDRPGTIEFIDSAHALSAVYWLYRGTQDQNGLPETLEGAIKFTKDTNEIRVKYNSLENYSVRLFAEGLVASRSYEVSDLEYWQPLIEKAIHKIESSRGPR